MSLARLGVEQPVLANLIAVCALVTGLVSYVDMPKRRMPIARVNTAIVTTVYPGASPEDVDRLVSGKLQEEIEDLDDIKEITALSREGLSTLFVEYDAELDDFDRAIIGLSAEIDKVKDLPESAESPAIEQARIEITAIYVGVWGDADEGVLREVALDLKDDLARVDGVSRVEFMAWRDREIWVELDPEKLEGFGLMPDQVSRVIADENRDIPAGSLRSGSGELLVRTIGEFSTPEEIADVAVYRDDAGAIVRVADLGRVVDTLEEPSRRTRLNGHDALVMEVWSANSADAFETVRALRGVLDEFREIVPSGVHITPFLDSTVAVSESLTNLVNNAVFGLLLVGLLLWLFMGFRSSMMAVIGLPVAILGGVTVLSLLGESVNRLTLFGMILILGVLVDDSIVVIENIQRHLAQKKDRVRAAIEGTDEVLWPVLAASTTTIAAFSSLFFVSGIMGEFFASIPRVVISALAASLVEALFILPSHMARHGSPAREDGDWRTTRMLIPLQRFYLRGLRASLRHRYLAVGAALGAAGLAAALGALLLDVKLVEQDEPEVVEIRIEMPTGTRLEATQEVIREIDRRVAQLPRSWFDDVFSISGYAREAGPGGHVGTQWGQIFLFLTSRRDREISGWDVIRHARELVRDVPGPVRNEVTALQNGPPTGAPVSIQVRGKDIEVLNRLAERIEHQLATIDGTKDIRSDSVPGKKEIRVRVDRRAAALVGLSNLDVARYLRTAYAGSVATVMKTPRGEVDVRVKFQEAQRSDASRLDSLMIRSRDGRLVALSEIADIEERVGDATITKVDGKRTVTITANVDEDVVTGVAVNQAARPFLERLRHEHPGYSFEAGGEFEMTTDSVHSLVRALLVSIVVIFAILGAQFRSYLQPLVVMAALPFSFIGVVLGLVISDVALSLVSTMGVIALAGIVVNDSLVLVDFVNRARRRGAGRWASLLSGGHQRIRPILLTTVTTMGGLLPLAYSFFGRDEMLGPMAVSIVWGISMATLLTLFLVPALYAIVDDVKTRLGRPPAPADGALLDLPLGSLIEQLAATGVREPEGGTN